MYNDPTPLISEDALKTWENAKNDPYRYMEQHYRTSSNFIMTHMKKVFGMTPILIRTGHDKSAK